MSSTMRTDYLAKALSVVTNGEQLLPLFQAARITSITSLLAKHASFASNAVDTDALQILHQILAAKGMVGSVDWKASFKTKKAGANCLRSIVLEAQNQRIAEQAEMAAIASAPHAASVASAGATTAPAALAVPPTDTAAQQRIQAAALFVSAEKVFNTLYEADRRAKYEQVAKCHKGMMEASPFSQPLGEYTTNLSISTSTTESYTIFGQEWISREGAPRAATIGTDAELYRQMSLRAQTEVVAGCYDVLGNASDKGIAAPTGNKISAESTVLYVDTDAAGKMHACKMACNATPKGQAIQIEMMQVFRERHPHIPLAKVVSCIDAGIQREIANCKMRGFTADAAVDHACKKCPELYAVSLVEGAAGSANETDKTGDKGGGKKRERTAAEAATANQRTIDQQKRQIDNLKSGKKTAGKGNGKDKAPTGQPPGPECPAGVCKDYNFKAVGCTRANCSYEHKCCQCGVAHPYKGNH